MPKTKDIQRIIFVAQRAVDQPQIYDSLYKALNEHGLRESHQIRKINISGLSTYSSIIKVFPENITYVNLQTDNILELIKEGFIKNSILDQFVCPSESRSFAQFGDIPFYHKQYRIVLRNCGLIDPESIDDYLAREGYKGFVRALTALSPKDIVNEMKNSGLRGRGGGGFPTGLKWEFTSNIEDAEKYVVCNADEGDPGAYMDRSVLESDPHSVLEGMAIAARAVGASFGYIYIRAEYPLAIARLEKALSDARAYGLLGQNILGTDFSFDIELRLGAGAFVCGEETALLTSIEGNRGMPKTRPPYPASKGVWEKPTVINNVETFANVPVILHKGAEWYKGIGMAGSSGTKVFALTGKVKNSGLVEVPMGVTLREIVYDIGGGIFKDIPIKGVQTGGPSGGVIPETHLDTPVSYETLKELGSIMGSGGMIVMDETDCVVDVAKFYLQFTVDESCGRCAPCRIGGKQLLDILTKISDGKGTRTDLALLKELGNSVKKTSLCGLGQTAPNPVLSTLNYFRKEFSDHVNAKRCSAGVCQGLIAYTIVPDKCIGCHLCAMRCPANAISGDKKTPHIINQTLCIKCGDCYHACKFQAILKG